MSKRSSRISPVNLADKLLDRYELYTSEIRSLRLKVTSLEDELEKAIQEKYYYKSLSEKLNHKVFKERVERALISQGEDSLVEHP